MFKKLLFITLTAGILVLVWMIFTEKSPSILSFGPDIPEQTASVTRSTEKTTLESLYKDKKPFSELALMGSITVVEVRSNTCGICKKLEKKFPAFQNARPDVLIYEVNLPDEGRRHFQSQEAAEKWMKEEDEKFEMYNFGGTPHIEIYDSEGKLIIADKGRNKKATEFLEKWIDSEL